MLSTPHRRAPPGFSDVIFQQDNSVIQPPNREIQLRFHHSKKIYIIFFFFFSPTWTMIYTYQLPVGRSLCRKHSPHLSALTGTMASGAACAARKKKVSAQNYGKCDFFAGPLKPFFVIRLLVQIIFDSKRHFPEFQQDS